MAHAQPLRQLVPQEARGMAQATHRLALLLWRPHHADVDLRQAQVTRHIDPRDAGEPDAWVFDTQAHQFTQLLRDHPTQLIWTASIWHKNHLRRAVRAPGAALSTSAERLSAMAPVTPSICPHTAGPQASQECGPPARP